MQCCWRLCVGDLNVLHTLVLQSVLGRPSKHFEMNSFWRPSFEVTFFSLYLSLHVSSVTFHVWQALFGSDMQEASSLAWLVLLISTKPKVLARRGKTLKLHQAEECQKNNQKAAPWYLDKIWERPVVEGLDFARVVPTCSKMKLGGCKHFVICFSLVQRILQCQNLQSPLPITALRRVVSADPCYVLSLWGWLQDRLLNSST